MAMQREFTATLDSRQVKQACEQFVAAKVKDDALAYAAEPSIAAAPGEFPTVVVHVTRKRVRKPRGSKAVEAQQAEVRG